MSKKTTAISAVPTVNPALPKVPITLNGKQYRLVFDFNAIARVEELTGMNLFGSFDFTNLNASKFRAMLYASLLKENPAITLDEAGELINAKNLAEITIKMVEAWHGSRPEIVKDESGNADAGESTLETSQS
jgi:hypothetical protein